MTIQKDQILNVAIIFIIPKRKQLKPLQNEIECKYNNRHYHRLRVNLPKGNSNRGSFECAYTFGPLCHYDIYIQEVE